MIVKLKYFIIGFIVEVILLGLQQQSVSKPPVPYIKTNPFYTIPEKAESPLSLKYLASAFHRIRCWAALFFIFQYFQQPFRILTVIPKCSDYYFVIIEFIENAKVPQGSNSSIFKVSFFKN